MKARLIAFALVAPIVLGACGTAKEPTAAPTTGKTVAAEAVAEIKAGEDRNDTDVMFLQMLAYHQKQGLEMTATAVKRAQSPELRTLAGAIQATEKDELEMIQSWLTGWGEDTVAGTAASLHADHGGLPGTGEAEIKALSTVKASEFDTAFLNLFLAHQHQAIEMSGIERTGGKNAEAKKFAERVRQSRQGEIQQMLKLMNG
ncbi:DUF305 domain-containing protein [Paractinoplanes deccanensis]|uniref:DUF305 domain-containing protein n=1 Tax=Paractinoplanes deccanensis TaxID=113561 RepID=A0ABQ3Y5R3_9ACTN|nr:DUF305 domain-containing protein [Actinoplanes deccanensis]GID75310.1 DUF305 domain-containing protein [Actinoplanes deccanensis]